MDEESTSKLPPQSNGNRVPVTQQGRIVQNPNKDAPTTPPSPPNKRIKAGVPAARIAVTILLLLLLVGAGAATLGYYYYNEIHKPLVNFIRPVGRNKNEPMPNTTPVYDVIKGRSWNILLLGSDNDGKYSYPAVLTQVMMVVHIDTVNNKVSLVSIPRDSWVNVPQAGMHKIDQAFLLGVQQNDKFEDGVQLARQTVEKDYGITIDRYAWVGLGGFAKVIDTLGGIDIDVTHPVVDDTYPNDTGQGSDPNDPYALTRLYIAPGPQHLNGEQALQYVRSRHADLVGDIGRTQRQQQVLEALKQKLTVASIVNNLPALIKDLTGQVYTDLNEEEMIAFANFGRTLSGSAIQRITLGPGDQSFGDYANVYDASTDSYQDVIIPHCNAIQPVVNRIFDLGNVQSCNITG